MEIKLKTDDCKFGEKLYKFRVRAAIEFAIPMEVVAHDAREAELVADHFCKAMGGERWQALADHVHMKFEATGVPGWFTVVGREEAPQKKARRCRHGA